MHAAKPISHAILSTTLATLGVTALSLPDVARAQQSEASVGTLEEITVTARKVSENLQDTPIAISAFSGAALENRQIFLDRQAHPDRPQSAVRNECTAGG